MSFFSTNREPVNVSIRRGGTVAGAVGRKQPAGEGYKTGGNAKGKLGASGGAGMRSEN